MKKFILALTLMILSGSARAFADTQTFSAYGAAMLGGKGARNVGSSVAFPGFTLVTNGFSLQVDAPGYFGATNYEMLGNQGDLIIDFTVPQTSFSIRLRDFAGFPAGLDTITVLGADDSTVLATYSVGLDSSVFTSTDNGESAPIGAVVLSEISNQEPWTGVVQSVTFSTPVPALEPASLSLLAIGVLGLARMIRRKLVP